MGDGPQSRPSFAISSAVQYHRLPGGGPKLRMCSKISGPTRTRQCARNVSCLHKKQRLHRWAPMGSQNSVRQLPRAVHVLLVRDKTCSIEPKLLHVKGVSWSIRLIDWLIDWFDCLIWFHLIDLISFDCFDLMDWIDRVSPRSQCHDDADSFLLVSNVFWLYKPMFRCRRYPFLFVVRAWSPFVFWCLHDFFY